jgi:hypothetical protein
MVRPAGTVLPNFLVVGAARAGTTSLYYYLKQHPQIFMSRIKEPRFIFAQFTRFPTKGIGDGHSNVVQNFHDYCLLFRESSGERAIGEASPDNLYPYKDAIPTIKRFLGDPKIVIMLRNPTERAFSAYMFLVRDRREFLSFEEALDQEDERIREGWAPIWFYRDAGFYYDSVKAYSRNFSNVKACLLDDLKKDPSSLVQELFGFLGVDPAFVPDTSTQYNVSGNPRSRMLNDFFITRSRLQTVTRRVGHAILGEDNWVKLRDTLRPKLLRRTELAPETRRRLEDVYRGDVLKLQDLIEKDLSHWTSARI